jgi:hypothetical protein
MPDGTEFKMSQCYRFEAGNMVTQAPADGLLFKMLRTSVSLTATSSTIWQRSVMH